MLRKPRKFTHWDTMNNQRLIEALISVKTPDELRRLLDDLLTKNEIDQCALRLQAAEMLFQGATYGAIAQTTHMSSATIARISKMLANRKGGLYEAMVRLHPHGRRYFD